MAMKLRRRTIPKPKVDKKRKATPDNKKGKVNSSVKKKKPNENTEKKAEKKPVKKTTRKTTRKSCRKGNKKSKATNKKITEAVEIIEIPPVVHCAIGDVAEVLKEASKEELELKNECSLIFECNKCDSFFRTLGAFLNHKTTFCSQSTSGYQDEEIMHQLYAHPPPTQVDKK